MLFALLGLRLLAVAGRVDLSFDGGQLALVPVAQGLATFHLARVSATSRGLPCWIAVMQRDDGGLEFGRAIRGPFRAAVLSPLALSPPASLVQPDRRVQRLRLAGEPVEASRLCLVVALLGGAYPVAQGQPFGRGQWFESLAGSPNHW